jgi:DGQHR domain-containing protein
LPDISVKATKVVHKDLPLYLFGMRAGDVLEIAYILPRSRDNPDAIERSLDWGRVDEIAGFIKKPNSYLPGAIILNLDTTHDGFGAFNEDENSAMFVIHRPKHDREAITAKVLEELGEDDPEMERVAIEIEKRLVKHATVIDGQHRLKGLERAAKLDVVVPIIALKNADLTKAAKIFVDINGEQKPVPQNFIQMIRYEIGAIDDALEQLATGIARKLGERADSPFHDRVKIYPEDKRTWIPAKSLEEMLYPIVGSGGPLEGLSEGAQTDCFVSFFKAFKAQWPEAFDDVTRKNSILTQPRGIQTALGIFERVWRRCQFYEHEDFSEAAILRQIAPLRIMTWSKTKYGPVKGAGGPVLLRTKLLDVLPEKDDRRSPEFEKSVKWLNSLELVL